MLRRIAFSGIAVGAILAVSAWVAGRSALVAQDVSPTSVNKSASPAPASRTDGVKSNEARLVAQASATAPLPGSRTTERGAVASDPIVILGGRLRLIDQEDVPSQRDGVLTVIGTEIRESEQVPPHEIVQVATGNTTRLFRRLKEGDAVQADQLLALVDDSLARADVAIKEAKVVSAEADRTASEKTREEAKSRYDTQVKLYYSTAGGTIRATSKEDLSGALLTYNKYVYETYSKEEAIKVAQQELNQAKKTLSMYEVRPKISGIVKAINKHRGEAVKSLDSVLQIQNYDHLRVDAWLQEQYANRLEKGMEVAIEPTFRESPKQTLIGHRGLVTGVAVGNARQKPLIVSCSDDRTVRIWEPSPGDGRMQEAAVLLHLAPVRAVACSGNLCLSGDEQGKGRLWDLNDRSGEKPPRELNGEHRRAITCVAFSPNRLICATGGEDQEIMVWNTDTGNLRYRISGHNNQVTALHFISDSRLISIGRDAVRFWNVLATRAEAVEKETIQRREPLVDDLGVSPDGRHMMDEQSGEMRIVSVPGARTEAILRSPLGKRFANFAFFSPDGKMALTTPQGAGSQAGGVIELWHIDKVRSYELRQFISPARGPIKSAAFAPDASFIVATINDRLDIYPMPRNGEGEQRFTGIITNIEKPIEAVGENQVKVTAEFRNLDQRLRPMDVVTMVAYPQK